MRKAKFIQLFKNIILGSIPFLVILVSWCVFYYLNQNLKWLVPSPIETASSFMMLISDGTLLGLILTSLINLVPPFIIATFCAVVLGTIMGINKIVYRIFHPILSAIYPIPSLAWLPFIILFLGFTREAIWFIIFISSFLRIIYSVISGVKNINIEYVLAAKNLGFSKFKIIRDVILPCAFPQIITGLRLGFGSAWRSLIGAEMLVVTLGGLGKFIWMAQWFFDFDKVIVGIVAISLISIFIEEIVFKRLEENTLVKWGFVREEYKI
jgi:ABC-type nitrate/sulfonate/bicarbonate transport system permease component